MDVVFSLALIILFLWMYRLNKKVNSIVCTDDFTKEDLVVRKGISDIQEAKRRIPPESNNQKEGN